LTEGTEEVVVDVVSRNAKEVELRLGQLARNQPGTASSLVRQAFSGERI
jgi:hypothetical protein